MKYHLQAEHIHRRGHMGLENPDLDIANTDAQAPIWHAPALQNLFARAAVAEEAFVASVLTVGVSP
jgi:hypothetical protein